MKEIILKNGKKAILRVPRKEDAQNMINYLNQIGGESDFLTFGENQFSVSLEAEEAWIESYRNSENSLLIVTTIEDEIVSISSIPSNKKERTRHNGVLGISILKKYWGEGLGSGLLDFLISWAKSNSITKRIELLVREDNHRAIKLYEKFGFEKEGIHKGDLYVKGVYYNTIIMALYIS
ncbi:MAG: GNAT family N-acetyltransferase [Paraclostridium sp.]